MIRKFTADQQDWIVDVYDENNIDLRVGYYWQILKDFADEEIPELEKSNFIYVFMTPKDHFDRTCEIPKCHGMAHVFLSEVDGEDLAEEKENVYVYRGSEDEFKAMITKYGSFFTEKEIVNDTE